MTPINATHGPESDDGRQDAPAATDAATEAREAIDLDAIEARAKAATPGPWERRTAPREGYTLEEKAEYMRGSAYDNGQPLQVLVAESPTPDLAYVIPALTGDGPTSEANAEHIAGMDPATTLALVRELREARAEVWADVAALLNDRAQMWEDGGRPVLTRELRELANAYRTYAEGVGIPSMQSLRQKRRAAEAERDDLRARLAKVEALTQWGVGRDTGDVDRLIPASDLRAALGIDR